MTEAKSSAPRARISSARVVPYQPETAKQFGGGARGRTLAIIYRQLSYWSKYAKWKGAGGKKFFYRSQKELAEELGYSEKTINRAIKALKELGLVLVEKLHKRYWKQVNFYHLPHSPFAAAAPTTSTTPAPERPVSAPTAPVSSFSTSTKPSSFSASPASGGAVHPAAAATAASIRTRGGGGFGQNVRISNSQDYKSKKLHSLQSVVERCYAIADAMKEEQGRGYLVPDAAGL